MLGTVLFNGILSLFVLVTLISAIVLFYKGKFKLAETFRELSQGGLVVLIGFNVMMLLCYLLNLLDRLVF